MLLSPRRSAAISVWSEHPAASRPRVSLTGNVTLFPELKHTPERDAIQECYLAQHPDARWWLPGPREPHTVSRRATLPLLSLPRRAADRMSVVRWQVYWARFDPHVRLTPFGGCYEPRRCARTAR